jgi:replicative superfamily II helicase
MIFIELPKFWKMFSADAPKEMETDLDKWMYYYVMCDDQLKLEDFLSKNDAVFQEYEEKVEEAAKMQTFIQRYESSPFHKLMSMLMTPEEEMEMVKSELEKTKKELEAKDKVLEAKDMALEAKDMVITLQADELEKLRKGDEASHSQANYEAGRQKSGVSSKRRLRRAHRRMH